MYWHNDMHAIWMVLFWLVVIGAGAIGLRYALGGPRPHDREGVDSPEEILKKRYARGEIDRDEYASRLEELRK